MAPNVPVPVPMCVAPLQIDLVINLEKAPIAAFGRNQKGRGALSDFATRAAEGGG
jgi:hypothetical protein